LAIHSTEELDKLEPGAPVSILVIDELTTSFEDLAFARYSLKKYLNTQGDTLQQPMMLISANYKNIKVIRDYTTSKREILDALDHHIADYGSIFTRAQNSSFANETTAMAFIVLTGVAKATAGHPGHKNMIWIGRGFPSIDRTQLTPTDEEKLDAELASCAGLLRNSRVTLYTIDPAGLVGQALDNSDDDFQMDPFGGQIDFDTMAILTGGKALHGRNDVDTSIDETVRDGESFYTLTYRPPTVSADEKPYRNTRVVMKDPSLRATTRGGYFTVPAPVAPIRADNGKYSSDFLVDLGTADSSLLVYDGLPMEIIRDANVPDLFTVRVEAAGMPVQTDADGKSMVKLTLVAQTFDRNGKGLQRIARLVTATVPTETGAWKIELPVKLSTLSPAARVRFIVRDNATGKLAADNYFLVDDKTNKQSVVGTQKRK
jgi:VWFA-related protein